jgi:hypothetical protein
VAAFILRNVKFAVVLRNKTTVGSFHFASFSEISSGFTLINKWILLGREVALCCEIKPQTNTQNTNNTIHRNTMHENTKYERHNTQTNSAGKHKIRTRQYANKHNAITHSTQTNTQNANNTQ